MILITGGLGYLGSHLATTLLEQGHDVILVDNLMNARMEMLDRIEYLAGRYVTFFKQDIRNTPALGRIFEQYAITGVVHLAAMKSPIDSVMQPLDYYNDNVGGLMSLLRVMQRTGVRNLVFSSSAAVYGPPDVLPVAEEAPIAPITPYGRSKAMSERILRDLYDAEPDWRIAVLRYFNPVGAHHSGVIGEWPNGMSTNLMPLVAQVASGQRDVIEIFGDDYDTSDGTGVRDYIHVQDLIDGHIKALAWLYGQDRAYDVFNLGRGEGVSVKALIDAFGQHIGQTLPTTVVARREGDLPSVYAKVDKAREQLDFTAQRTLDDMVKDTWNFYSKL